jgi:heme A synthase
VRASWAGLALLLVQAVFGGLTVLWELPDLLSTTHLALAFLFLILAVTLAAVTSPRRAARSALDAGTRRLLGRPATIVTELVFMQSLLGAWVRHTDAGMVCGTGLLCNGALIPTAWSPFIAVQFLHRAVGIATAVVVVALAVPLTTSARPGHVRVAAGLALALVLAQVTVGFLSVSSILAVVPVSLHTLGAAALMAVVALLATWGRMRDPERSGVGA